MGSIPNRSFRLPLLDLIIAALRKTTSCRASNFGAQLREDAVITSLGAAGFAISRESTEPPAAQTQTNRNAAKDRQLAVLMRSAQQGNRAAYVSLLREVAQILNRVVQSRAWFLAAADREDLVQDVLLSLHAARATYDPQRPFLPWLMSIAHNRIIDHARRNSRRSSNEVLVDKLPEVIADDGLGTPMSEYGDPKALHQAIKNLPPVQRTAIELLKLREMSLKEAAQVSGMSIGALKVAIHRAIKALRASL
jgi:RNA polymerase sigma factor (sigma-70 family)